jgi:hypothetical protein
MLGKTAQDFEVKEFGDFVSKLNRIFVKKYSQTNPLTWTDTLVRGETCTGFWWRNLRERDHWGDRGVDERIVLRCIFRKWDVGV